MADAGTAAKSILALGEEKMGEVIKLLLANETFVEAMQQTMVGTLQAKRTVDKGISTVLSFANIPSVEDYDVVKGRLEEVETMLISMQQRLAALDARLTNPPAKTAPKARSKR
jgi:hypothetical protein